MRLLYFFGWAAMLYFSMACLGCRKFLDPGSPEGREVAEKVFHSDSLAEARLKGIYTKIGESFGFLHGAFTRYADLSSDELHRTTSNAIDSTFLGFTVDKNNVRILDMWSQAYKYIFGSNEVIEGLKTSTITPSLRAQLLGEALFLRGLTLFYLVNAFGEVPLIITTDYKVNAQKPRSPVVKVYEQIVNDLEEAQSLLSVDYIFSTAYPSHRLRANRYAASALLARVYLYLGRWAESEAAASNVIQSSMYQLESNPNQVFLYSSREVILQFMSFNLNFHAAEGSWFVPSGANPRPAYIISSPLLASIEPGDARNAWIRKAVVNGVTYYSPYKYKGEEGNVADEFNTVLRLAELYLIRAEARAMQTRLDGAVQDLNTIRTRAQLPLMDSLLTVSQALDLIEQERRVELFCEWGHRWLDLKRWRPRNGASDPSKARIDEVMPDYKPSLWSPKAKLWPVPGSEIVQNPNLTQNPGY